MTGINIWFIIEIMSFYCYILSAIIFIWDYSLRSSLGWLKKDKLQNAFKFDFVDYFRLDLDWIAFVTILTVCNVVLMTLDATAFEAERIRYNLPPITENPL